MPSHLNRDLCEDQNRRQGGQTTVSDVSQNCAHWKPKESELHGTRKPNGNSIFCSRSPLASRRRISMPQLVSPSKKVLLVFSRLHFEAPCL
ncbi:hypothetical protein Plim_1882 [Planctopirus limnophila DSM 3776]|uniref:Uncharacterized protein n=1 Tax=Planctopirus limnophila (strain ATCC 43296 / DSM 3776 / IFAM 1008 / Mu 290) TaxID=521674 RepID=D5SYI4_PLAL2|nr:hypothetical protein Plim_1882 [Planctopirus limnophila DSM 3776]